MKRLMVAGIRMSVTEEYKAHGLMRPRGLEAATLCTSTTITFCCTTTV